jgi:hypothetical protein
MRPVPASSVYDCKACGTHQTQVDRTVLPNQDAHLTIKIGRPGEAMRVFDVAGVDVLDHRCRLALGVRPAICKSKHRAQQAATDVCCSPEAKASACC